MHHLLHVYRARPGMQIALFDRDGMQYEAVISACNKKAATLEILSCQPPPPPPPVRIVLAQALVKSKSWDVILQKCMELGVYRLVPVIPEHLADGPDCAGHPERWEKVLLAAAKQCGRTSLMPIAPACKLTTLLAVGATSASLRLLAHNDTALPTLKSCLARHPEMSGEVLLLVGPEGGFSRQELAVAQAQGITMFQFGRYTLRAETAAVALVSALHFHFEIL